MSANLNPRPRERPVKVSTTYAAIRSTVAQWQGRTLSVQPSYLLLRSIKSLESKETELSQHSPHAVRLLASLRAEYAKPNRPADAA